MVPGPAPGSAAIPEVNRPMEFYLLHCRSSRYNLSKKKRDASSTCCPTPQMPGDWQTEAWSRDRSGGSAGEWHCARYLPPLLACCLPGAHEQEAASEVKEQGLAGHSYVGCVRPGRHPTVAPNADPKCMCDQRWSKYLLSIKDYTFFLEFYLCMKINHS